jgi:single-strand DNA-binding protein
MLNETRLIGRLGQNPEIRKTESGRHVASLNVTTWECYVDKNKPGEFITVNEWHKIVAWGDQVPQRIAKMKTGDLVVVAGKIATRKYTDNSGVDRWITEIVGTVKLLPNNHGKSGKQPDAPLPSEEPAHKLDNNAPAPAQQKAEPVSFPAEPINDLPF